MRIDVRRWTCDRCGMHAEVENHVPGDHLVPKDWRALKVAGLADDLSLIEPHHLCPACVKAFEVWLSSTVEGSWAAQHDPDEIGVSIAQMTQQVLGDMPEVQQPGTREHEQYYGKRRKETPESPFLEGMRANEQQGLWEIVDEDEKVLADGFISQEAAAGWWHERARYEGEEAPDPVTFRQSPR